MQTPRQTMAHGHGHDPATAAVIVRDIAAAEQREHDVVVIGAGIYGVCVTLEAARRGLKPLLLERDDFGGATSWSSLRIVHGGLRYLQKLDLPRFRESVAARRWFQQALPDLVRPLSCLMPLYGEGLRRPRVFRLALALNDWLSRKRNVGLREDVRLEAGRVVDAATIRAMFESVDARGLRGGGLWHDAFMISSERVLMELLRWACAAGAQAINYADVKAIAVDGGRVTGVEAIDGVTGRSFQVRASRVINCGGPWSRLVARRLDRDLPQLAPPSMAFNMLLDRPALSQSAVAVTPRRPGARTYFLLPWHGRVFAGTSHLPWRGQPQAIGPDDAQIQAMLDDLNEAVPALAAQREHVMRIYAGLVPATAEGSDTTADRPALMDHAAVGGPTGLVTLMGVKYTTAPLEAVKALRLAFGSALPAMQSAWADAPSGAAERAGVVDGDTSLDRLGRLAREEAVVHLDDLLLRRVDLPMRADEARERARQVCRAMIWDDATCQRELARLEGVLKGLAFGGSRASESNERRSEAAV